MEIREKILAKIKEIEDKGFEVYSVKISHLQSKDIVPNNYMVIHNHFYPEDKFFVVSDLEVERT